MVFVLLFTSYDVFFDGIVSLSLISHGALKASCIRHHHNWISLAYLLAGIFLKTQLLWITPGLVGHAALLRRQGSSAEQDPWLADRTSLPWCFVGHCYPDHQVTDHICFLLASASSFHLPRQTIEVQKVVFEELLLVVQADKILPFEDVAKNISDLLPKFLNLYILQMSSIVSVPQRLHHLLAPHRISASSSSLGLNRILVSSLPELYQAVPGSITVSTNDK